MTKHQGATGAIERAAVQRPGQTASNGNSGSGGDWMAEHLQTEPAAGKSPGVPVDTHPDVSAADTVESRRGLHQSG